MMLQCSNPDCREFFDPEFFRADASARNSKRGRRVWCRGCDDTRRDSRKRDDRWIVKARDTIRRHAQRLKIPVTVLIEKYGWEPPKVAHRMEHAYGNGCCYCDDLFANMGHGLGDVSIDVIDPRKEPFWRTNTNVACMSCNRRKGNLVPEVWAIVLQNYKKWKARREALKTDPWIGSLLEGSGYIGSVRKPAQMELQPR